MLCLQPSTLLYLSPHVDVAVFAHPSWEPYGPQINATLFVLLDETARRPASQKEGVCNQP